MRVFLQVLEPAGPEGGAARIAPAAAPAVAPRRCEHGSTGATLCSDDESSRLTLCNLFVGALRAQ